MKEKILEKASEMFLNLGFKSVTMDEIATELSISKKTVYSHFKNKNCLVEDACGYLSNIIHKGINLICNKQQNSVEELFEIKAFVMKNLNNEKSSPQFQLQKFFPDIYAKVQNKNFDLMYSCILENLKRGVNEGIYRPDINYEFITRIYYSGIHSIKHEDLFSVESFEKNQLMNLYLDYHVRAIATTKGIKSLEAILKTDK